MQLRSLSPLAASLVWIGAVGFCLAAFRYGTDSRGAGVTLTSFLCGFGGVGGAVGSWFREPVLGLMIGIALGVIALTLL